MYILCQLICGYDILLLLCNKYYYNNSINISKLFNVKFTGDNYKNIDKTTKAVLINHVSFADFFIDNCVLQGHGCYLSRWIIFIIMPFSSILSLLANQIYFFKRGNNKLSQLHNIVHTICNKNNRILIVYPEGTRNKTLTPIPLKLGMIKALYDKKIPLQIININNKHHVINEKTIQYNKNVTCNVIISQQLDPALFDTFDNFTTKICEIWINIFQ